jgi:ABC-type branched-subunit amino acid transport system substrate-binding protein
MIAFGAKSKGWLLVRSPRRALGVLAALLVVAAACGNAKPTVSNTGNVAGVTPTRITVGGVASLTGPIPADFAPIFDGVNAYLDMVNEKGGVDGRKIDFAYPLDDGSNPSQDTDQVRTLVGQDHVFAVVGVGTPTFAGASYLAANNVPTFGYAVSTQWTAGPSLFGAEGSYIAFTRPGPEPAYLAEMIHAKAVGILAYNVSGSSQGCIGVAHEMKRFAIPVVYEDLSVQAPPVDLTTDVNRMKAAGVDLVASCMDLSGNILLSRTMHQDGMGSVAQYWLNGYDETAIKSYASLMQGVYFLIGHVPFESAKLTPGKYPGMDLYLRELAKYFPHELPGEASLAGWVNADLFVTGLRLAGRDLTRKGLVAALNDLTAFNAGGIVAPIDWRFEHRSDGPVDCNVYVRALAGRFVPLFGSARTVFTCFRYPQPATARRVVLVPPPAGVPGT